MVRQAFAPGVLLLAIAGAVQGAEDIGPYTIEMVPSSVTIINAYENTKWLNVVAAPITFADAFTGPGIADRGFYNQPSGQVLELTFPAPVMNTPGPDLVMFDARFSVNEYALSADYDGFTQEAVLAGDRFTETGESRAYYYGMGGGAQGPTTVPVVAAAVDLSDVGVPEGQAILSVRFRNVSSEADPLGIGALGGTIDPCDLDRDGDFDRRDMLTFFRGCRRGEATWECEKSGDERFDYHDLIGFVSECR